MAEETFIYCLIPDKEPRHWLQVSGVTVKGNDLYL